MKWCGFMLFLKLGGLNPMAHLVKSTTEAPEPWVDVRTLADHIGFGYQTVLRMADDGLIPGKAFQSGRKTYWRFRLSDVDAALKEPARDPK
jgi:hypothetical protein